MKTNASFAAIYRNLPVRIKLRVAILSSVVVALTLAFVAVLAYDQISTRKSMQSDMQTLAQIIGSNSTAALTFADQKAAAEMLSGLRAQRHVEIACMYSAEGR